MRLASRVLRVVAATWLLATAGCATMNEKECLTADWRTVGYEDGADGRSGARIADHREACAKYGVAPDLTAYQAGREEGLRQYCRPANGFRIGSQGGSYMGQCPVDLEPDFLDAYQSGRQLHLLEDRLANLTNQLNARHGSLRSAESEVIAKSAIAISSEATTEERARAVADVKALGERVGNLKSEIQQLEAERVHSERDVSEYRATLRDWR